MKIAVLVKTVRFVYAQTGTDLKNNCIAPEDVVTMVNPLDEAALEMALRLKDGLPGSSVTAISLGDGTAQFGLKKSLALGVDHAVHVKFEGREQLDAQSASELLSLACSGEDFDLILCGASAIDDNDGLEGAYVAERLHMPHVTRVVEISLTGKRLAVQRVVERGDRQLMECTLPALITVEKGSVVPRYPTLAGSLRSETARIPVLTPETLGVKSREAILGMMATEVVGYCNPKPKQRRDGTRSQFSAAQRLDMMVQRDNSKQKQGGTILEGASPELFTRLDQILVKAGVLKQ